MTGAGGSQVKQACTVLFSTLPRLDADRLRLDLEPQVGACLVEWAAPRTGDLSFTAGVAQFGSHKIATIALAAPIKEGVLARTVAVSPMPDEQRSLLTRHKAAIRLLYMGDDSSPLSQLTALYMVACALTLRGGLGILNERAALAQPSELVAKYFEALGTDTPPLSLWVGTLTFNRGDAGAKRYLMRTYGLEQFGLPELATYFIDRLDADRTYHALINIGLYMVEGAPSLSLQSGQTAEFLGRTYLFTDPQSNEPELSSPSGLLLLVPV